MSRSKRHGCGRGPKGKKPSVRRKKQSDGKQSFKTFVFTIPIGLDVVDDLDRCTGSYGAGFLKFKWSIVARSTSEAWSIFRDALSAAMNAPR